MAIINGWGRGAWDEGAWGEALPVTLSTVGAITSGLGSVTVQAEANASPGTLAITSGIGSLTVNAKANVSPTGQAVTVSLGAPSTFPRAVWAALLLLDLLLFTKMKS
jgi:hypothetical protein